MRVGNDVRINRASDCADRVASASRLSLSSTPVIVVSSPLGRMASDRSWNAPCFSGPGINPVIFDLLDHFFHGLHFPTAHSPHKAPEQSPLAIG